MALVTRFYLDWFPVSTVPIENKISKHGGLTKHSLPLFLAQCKDDNKLREAVACLFVNYPDLLAYHYVLRLDGIFIFQIVCSETTTNEHLLRIPRDVSDFLKRTFGHIYEFSIYPDSLYGVTSFSNAAFSRGKEQMNIALYVSPIEMEDPFCGEYFAEAGKRFRDLIEIMDPTNNANLGQLRTRATAIRPRQRACLRLRGLYSIARRRCIDAYEREKTSRIYEILTFILLSIVILFVTLFTFSQFFHLGIKTSFSLSFLSSLSTSILYVFRQYPKLEIIQGAVGFYTYVAIYSRVTEHIYSNIPAHKFCNNTGNFSEIIKGLEARYNIEKEQLDKHKYLASTTFAVFAILVAVAKVGLELDRLPGYFDEYSTRLGEKIESLSGTIGPLLDENRAPDGEKRSAVPKEERLDPSN